MYDFLLKISNEFLNLSKFGINQYTKTIENLKQYVSDSPPYYYIHFSGMDDFFGVNVKSDWGNIPGIYTYPLTSNIYSKIFKKSRFFASDKPFIHLYKSKANNVLHTANYSDEDLKNDLEKLKEFLTETDIFYIKNTKLQEESFKMKSSPANFIWMLIAGLPDNRSSEKGWYLFNKVLGYDAIEDDGNVSIGIKGETLFFSTKYLERVDVISNIGSDYVLPNINDVETLDDLIKFIYKVEKPNLYPKKRHQIGKGIVNKIKQLTSRPEEFKEYLEARNVNSKKISHYLSKEDLEYFGLID